MKKILVPTDFSKEASIATDLGFEIAKKSDADLVLFHVVEEGSAISSSFNVEGQGKGCRHASGRARDVSDALRPARDHHLLSFSRGRSVHLQIGHGRH